MPALTPDSELELAFDPVLIPSSVREDLPDHLHIRPLALTDHSRGHLTCLAVLTSAPDPGQNAWELQFKSLVATPGTYYPLAVLDRAEDRIVGLGTVVIERKFIRGLGSVGHIEDIVVDKSTQGTGLGKKIILALTGISETLGAYKTILDCSEANEPFYVKCGYKHAGVEMARYKADVSQKHASNGNGTSNAG